MSDLPLSKAARRRKETVALAAQGERPQVIADKLGVSRRLVRDMLALPETQADLTKARARVKARIMGRAEDLVDGTLDVVQDAITQKDAKSLDAAARAAMSLEKLTVSASGEAQRVEVSGQVNVDVRALLAKYAAS